MKQEEIIKNCPNSASNYIEYIHQYNDILHTVSYHLMSYLINQPTALLQILLVQLHLRTE